MRRRNFIAGVGLTAFAGCTMFGGRQVNYNAYESQVHLCRDCAHGELCYEGKVVCCNRFRIIKKGKGPRRLRRGWRFGVFVDSPVVCPLFVKELV